MTAVGHRLSPGEDPTPPQHGVLCVSVITSTDVDSVCASVHRELSMPSVLRGKRREGKALGSLWADVYWESRLTATEQGL